ncbi:hypothetical protein [Rubrivirga sp.]|uniref:hypothetical protein n=1 Tax=Rubrivirga sp. TaxID=1885344 RepID=UPI003C775070
MRGLASGYPVAHPLRQLRRPALVRALAALVVAGVGLTLAPTAVAGARADAVRAVLDDVAAFELALEAAHASDDPVEAFAQAYAMATDGAVTAEAVVRLLGSTSMSGVTPVPVEDTRARAAIAGPAPSASPAFATSPSRFALEDVPAALAVDLADHEDGRATASPSQPRGP